MSNTDITIGELNTVGEANAQYVVSLIRSIPDFPKHGILFRDFMPVLSDPRANHLLNEALIKALPVQPDEFDTIAGLEARGFLIGPPMAELTGKGFVAVRKAGKLPPDTYAEDYSLEYGSASIEIERNAIHKGERILLVDDLIATGGSALAARRLIEQAGGIVVGCSFVMELNGLHGREALGLDAISSLMTMPA
ncbi:adenine phosphoribosyltransferase [Bifidobacterium aquikefiri]|uniref:Adenine phosphoribosyltransferase n=1 Tax=Bifidobacterium aquikefiri TaxID=1653207 RepID=A0A261G6F0_9BIFI|nr:adenine phosphoribosyltransferase [Bifidobacterium aquikefiri]OZG66982.1 Adenine phosphoribosyltransferase [Bifidobacterium aquikefiri]